MLTLGTTKPIHDDDVVVIVVVVIIHNPFSLPWLHAHTHTHTFYCWTKHPLLMDYKSMQLYSIHCSHYVEKVR